jgi:hypothetical protein
MYRGVAMVKRSACMAAEALNEDGNRGLVLWLHVEYVVQNLLYCYGSSFHCCTTAQLWLFWDVKTALATSCGRLLPAVAMVIFVVVLQW